MEDGIWHPLLSRHFIWIFHFSWAREFLQSVTDPYSNTIFLRWLLGYSSWWIAGIYRYMLYFVICPLTGFHRSPPDKDDDCRLEGTLDGVQWEYHLSRANTSKTIHDQLLTLHYIFAIKGDDFGAKTRALECISKPLMRGGLAWFRVSFCKLPADWFHELIVETLWREWSLWNMVRGGHRHAGFKLDKTGKETTWDW